MKIQQDGKGRIGLMVSSYLVYAGILAEEAHQVYADKGTTKYLQVSYSFSIFLSFMMMKILKGTCKQIQYIWKYLQVMIPSQRRYVNYWHKSLTFFDGCLPEVNLPKPCSKVIKRIRLFDTKTIESVFFVVSEMQEVAGQRYRSPAVAYRNFCSKSRNGGFWNSEIEEDEPRNCLDHYFNEKTIQV